MKYGHKKDLIMFLLLLFTSFYGSGQTQKQIDSLLSANQKEKNVKVRIENLLDITRFYSKQNVQKTLQYGNEAIETARSINDPGGIAKARNLIGVMYQINGRQDSALHYFNQALAVHESSNNQKEIISTLVNIGATYRMKVDYEKAIQYHNRALNIAQKINDVRSVILCNVELGTNCEESGRISAASKYFLSAIKEAEKDPGNIILGRAYNNLGKIYRIEKDYASATSFFEKAVQIFKKSNDALNEGIAYVNLCTVAVEAGNRPLGIKYSKDALAIFEKTHFTRGMLVCYNNLGSIQTLSGNYEEGIKYYHESLKIINETKNTNTIVQVLQNLGFSYLLNNDIKNSEKYFNQAEENIKILKVNPLHLREYYNHRSSLDSALNNYKNAFDNRTKFIRINDSLVNEDLAKQIKELNIKYETEKKEAAIKLLNSENALQKQTIARNELLLLNNELELDKKNLLLGNQNLLIDNQQLELKNNQSRLAKNNLELKNKEQKINILNLNDKNKSLEIQKKNRQLLFGVIAFLLSALTAYLLYNRYRLRQKNKLQKAIIKEQDETAKAVINAEENERQRMGATLHDGLGQLLSAAKMNMQAVEDKLSNDDRSVTIYNRLISLLDDSIKEVRSVSHEMMPNAMIRTGLGNSLKTLIEKIESNSLEINLNVDNLNENIDPDIQTVLYRIFQESINNVIKHAKASRLFITLTQENNNLYATIEDNGIGFDKDKLLKSQTGIGLDNIITRIKFLKGKVDIDSSPGKGTTLSFEIPLKLAA